MEPLPPIIAPPTYCTEEPITPLTYHQEATGPTKDSNLADTKQVGLSLGAHGDVLTSGAVNTTQRIKAYLIQFNHTIFLTQIQRIEAH